MLHMLCSAKKWEVFQCSAIFTIPYKNITRWIFVSYPLSACIIANLVRRDHCIYLSTNWEFAYEVIYLFVQKARKLTAISMWYNWNIRLPSDPKYQICYDDLYTAEKSSLFYKKMLHMLYSAKNEKFLM